MLQLGGRQRASRPEIARRQLTSIPDGDATDSEITSAFVSAIPPSSKTTACRPWSSDTVDELLKVGEGSEVE